MRKAQSILGERWWISRSASASFREISTCRHVSGVSGPILSSSIGTGCQKEATSRPSSSLRCLPQNYGRASLIFGRSKCDGVGGSDETNRRRAVAAEAALSLPPENVSPSELL